MIIIYLANNLKVANILITIAIVNYIMEVDYIMGSINRRCSHYFKDLPQAFNFKEDIAKAISNIAVANLQDNSYQS